MTTPNTGQEPQDEVLKELEEYHFPDTGQAGNTCKLHGPYEGEVCPRCSDLQIGQAGKTLGQINAEAMNVTDWSKLHPLVQMEWENSAKQVAAAAVREKDETIIKTQEKAAFYAGEMAKMATELKEKDEEIARLQKPWSVVMSLSFDGNGYEQVDCNILDVGHADRILLVETPPVVKTSLVALREKDERIKVLEKALYKIATTNPWHDIWTTARAALNPTQGAKP